MSSLKERLSTTNIDDVKADVISYIEDKSVLDIWSNDYFLMLADRIRFL